MRPCLSTILALSALSGLALEPEGGGAWRPPHDHMPAAERARIEAMLVENQRALELPASGRARITGLIFPLRARPAWNGPDFGGVSNFVDLNPAFPNQLLDFHCGARTYDLASGYNHAGIDYFLWPFPWRMMDAEVIEIVAAAPGTLLGKDDGNPDRSCNQHTGPQWNAVYVLHADGTVAWYGHMKAGTLTPKPIGAGIAAGEYLGLVGSSGFSSGPHLHLELRSSNLPGSVAQEPHAGECRSGSSQWASQRPYFDSRIVLLATHGAPPDFNVPCPNPTQETPNFRNQFQPGELARFAAYYRDQLRGDLTQYRIRRPDGSVWREWQHAMNDPNHAFYAASYWFWGYTLPADAAQGTWTFEAEFSGGSTSVGFAVGSDQLLRNGFEPP